MFLLKKHKTHGLIARMAIFMLALLIMPFSAGGDSTKLGALEAAYIYNFTKFTSWPKNTWTIGHQNNLNLCLYGQDDIIDELKLLNGKKVQHKIISTTHSITEESLGYCHVLYISPSQLRRYEYIINILADKPVLTIGNDPRFLNAGGIISLVQQEDKLRFEVNVETLKHTPLTLSSKLLALAIISDDGAMD